MFKRNWYANEEGEHQDFSDNKQALDAGFTSMVEGPSEDPNVNSANSWRGTWQQASAANESSKDGWMYSRQDNVWKKDGQKEDDDDDGGE